MIIKNVNIKTMSSEGTLKGGWIRVEDGKISAIGTGALPSTCECEKIIDGEGAWALPGFIDAHTHLGILEDSLNFEGDDVNEDSDPSTPHLRTIDAINPFDRCFEEARLAGVTSAAVAPGSANPIGGQICVLKTVGHNVDKMLIKEPAAMKFALGENPKSVYRSKNSPPVTRMATAAIIRENLAKAKRYLDEIERAKNDEDVDEPEFDMRNEALLPVLKGEVCAHFHSHRADDICTALRIAREFDIRPVIVHATEAHLIVEELEGIPLIVGPNLSDRSKPELRNMTIENPRKINEAGLECSITTDHPVTPLNMLSLCASYARSNGMDIDAALRAITINPARTLGIDARVGSIEVGKDADIVLIRGELLTLDMKIVDVFIDGNSVMA